MSFPEPDHPESLNAELSLIRAKIQALGARVEKLEKQARGPLDVAVDEPLPHQDALSREQGPLTREQLDKLLGAKPVEHHREPQPPAVELEPIPTAAAPTPPRHNSPEFAPTFSAPLAKAVTAPSIDWEKTVGTRWMTWVGAFALLLAVGFGVHWTWSTFHAPPWLQVSAFHVLGLGLIAGAYFLNRRELPLAARALLGLGIFTLYASAFAAQHMYQMWDDKTASTECAVITALAIVLALRADSAAVILLGALGGYLTPILTSTGSGNYVGLFTYLAFLNVALVSAAAWRGWSFLKPLALVATALMFCMWIVDDHFHRADSQMLWGTEWFAALHASIFLIGSLVPPLAWKRTSQPADLLALGAGSLLFMGFTWILFRHSPDQQLALVSWGLSALHAALFGLTYTRVTNVDRMPRVHLALAAVFLTLAIPLQLDDSAYWSTTWCVEGFIFTAVGLYFADKQMCATALIVLVLASIRLLIADFHSAPRTIGATDIDLRCVLFVASGLLMLLSGGMYRLIPWLLRRELPRDDFHRSSAGVISALGAVMIALAPLLQLHDFTYLGPVWAVEALAFTVVGLLVTDRQLCVTGAFVFLAAGVRLLAFDFLTPRRAWGASEIDIRCGAFLLVGFMALAACAIYRVIVGARRAPAPQNDVVRYLYAGLLALAALLITFSPVLQLHEWTYLGPIWCLEALAFTFVAVLIHDAELCLIGLAVFMVAAVRLVSGDFLSLPQPTPSGWDKRFLVIEFSALLSLVAGGMYWLIPRITKRGNIPNELEARTAGILLGAGNIALLAGLLCQWDTRLILVLWTIDAAIVWFAGFRLRSEPVRWYALAVAIVMVGGRALRDGWRLDAPFVLLINSRFASLALVAALYFGAGWMYRRIAGQHSDGGQALQKLLHRKLEKRDESALDLILGALGNAVLLIAITMEIHSWYENAARVGPQLFPDMHMAEMATYSVVWAIYAAILVAVGFSLRYPLFRILGLLGFGVIVLKVFFVDLENLRWLPRVLALAVLGVTLIGVSMLYQKFASRMQQET